jgi:hypothetical protein
VTKCRVEGTRGEVLSKQWGGLERGDWPLVGVIKKVMNPCDRWLECREQVIDEKPLRGEKVSVQRSCHGPIQ